MLRIFYFLLLEINVVIVVVIDRDIEIGDRVVEVLHLHTGELLRIRLLVLMILRL